MITTKNKFGLLHSYNDKPSLIDDEGNKYWHINGLPSRLDMSLPYIEKSDGEKHYILENGGKRIISHLIERWLDKDNKFHKNNGPADIEYYENGNIKYLYYYLNGKLHNKDGPADIEYYKKGNIEREYYYLNGKLHRNNDPADIWYYYDGNIQHKNYYLNGYKHREDGPAYIVYDQNGNIKHEAYYINGILYSKEEHLDKTKKLNL
jgi:hypothetical protein